MMIEGRFVFRGGSCAVGLALVVACAGPLHTPAPVRVVSLPAEACAKLRIEPQAIVLPTAGAALLHASGGSGSALFSLEGDLHGATIEPGGGLRAGDAARFTVVATDGACSETARAQVVVKGPFVVEPESIALDATSLRSVQFEATGAVGKVEYTLLTPDDAAKLSAGGRFERGGAARSYSILARDTGSGREARLTVQAVAGPREKLRPRTPYLAVPHGGRVRLDWRGGSRVVRYDGARGSVVQEGGASFFDASHAAPGTAVDVVAIDCFTGDQAEVTVFVGDVLGAPLIARGTQSSQGDMASGDVNGDGIADPVVGHAERSKAGPEAGGILVYYGKADGTFADHPDAIEGDHDMDRYGSVLAVRDLNGDGIDDVVAGVPDCDLGDRDRGVAVLFFGSKGGIEHEPNRVLLGEGPNQRFGSAIALADIDGDGALDIAVSATNARSAQAPQCDAGKVYVYENEHRPREVILAQASPQILDVRDTLSDDPEAPLGCAPTPQGAGRSLALVDVDGDRVLDLVVGAPQVSYPNGGKGHGAVLVFRGLGAHGKSGHRFEETPSWSIHLDPKDRADGALFGTALDVVPVHGVDTLIVRSPTFAHPDGLGAAWVFPRGSLGAPPTQPKQVRNVLASVGKALFGPPKARGFGRSTALADVEAKPGVEYVVAAVTPGAPSTLFAYDLGDLGASPPLATVDVGQEKNRSEMEGFRIAKLAGKPQDRAGLAIWAPWRSTKAGAFAGAIDYVKPLRGGVGPASLSERWPSRVELALPSFGVSDRAGTAVALGVLAGGAPEAIVGAPGAHSPPSPGHAAGEHIRTGTVDVFGPDSARPIARAVTPRNDAQLGGGPLAVLDFDGDGTPDLAVGDPGESFGGPLPANTLDLDGCAPLGPDKKPMNVGGRGVVRIYSMVNGALTLRFLITAPKEEMHTDGGPRFWKNRSGFSLVAADVNGDGKDDLVLGRRGDRDSSGAEIRPRAEGRSERQRARRLQHRQRRPARGARARGRDAGGSHRLRRGGVAPRGPRSRRLRRGGLLGRSRSVRGPCARRRPRGVRLRRLRAEVRRPQGSVSRARRARRSPARQRRGRSGGRAARRQRRGARSQHADGRRARARHGRCHGRRRAGPRLSRRRSGVRRRAGPGHRGRLGRISRFALPESELCSGEERAVLGRRGLAGRRSSRCRVSASSGLLLSDPGARVRRAARARRPHGRRRRRAGDWIERRLRRRALRRRGDDLPRRCCARGRPSSRGPLAPRGGRHPRARRVRRSGRALRRQERQQSLAPRRRAGVEPRGRRWQRRRGVSLSSEGAPMRATALLLILSSAAACGGAAVQESVIVPVRRPALVAERVPLPAGASATAVTLLRGGGLIALRDGRMLAVDSRGVVSPVDRVPGEAREDGDAPVSAFAERGPDAALALVPKGALLVERGLVRRVPLPPFLRQARAYGSGQGEVLWATSEGVYASHKGKWLSVENAAGPLRDVRDITSFLGSSWLCTGSELLRFRVDDYGEPAHVTFLEPAPGASLGAVHAVARMSEGMGAALTARGVAVLAQEHVTTFVGASGDGSPRALGAGGGFAWIGWGDQLLRTDGERWEALASGVALDEGAEIAVDAEDGSRALVLDAHGSVIRVVAEETLRASGFADGAKVIDSRLELEALPPRDASPAKLAFTLDGEAVATRDAPPWGWGKDGARARDLSNLRFGPHEVALTWSSGGRTLSKKLHFAYLSPLGRVPSYERDVAPILASRCARCHGKGGVGRDLSTLSAATAQAEMIRSAVREARMPPDLLLDTASARVITAWVDGDSPK